MRRFRSVGSDHPPPWPPATHGRRKVPEPAIHGAQPSGWAFVVAPPLQPLLPLRTSPPRAVQRPARLRWAGARQWFRAGSSLAAQRLAARLSRSLSLVLALVLLVPALPALAAPGLCVGPVCGDEFSRSALYHWQLRLRLNDQQGHRERLVVDCRTGALSPQQGLVERGYAGAVARRACRLVAEGKS